MKRLTRRSEVLDELVPFATAVELQDSLQHLASLDSAARMVVIDTLIARVIQKEEEEKRLAKEAERDAMREACCCRKCCQCSAKTDYHTTDCPYRRQFLGISIIHNW
ncbi:hypothetical protein NXX53_25190 [Bacteroides salyersiae]|nr:hypothetical protein [Bacteroides salyersiae]